MTDEKPDLHQYFGKLSSQQRAQLRDRMERYRDALETVGYTVTIAEDEMGYFAGVLVIDEKEHRYGFLEEDGTVNWLSSGTGGIGALGSAVVQNPADELVPDEIDDDHINIE